MLHPAIRKVAQPSLNRIRYGQLFTPRLAEGPILPIDFFQHKIHGDQGQETPMISPRLIFLLFTISTTMAAQDSSLPATLSSRPASTQMIALKVARNTPL